MATSADKTDDRDDDETEEKDEAGEDAESEAEEKAAPAEKKAAPAEKKAAAAGKKAASDDEEDEDEGDEEGDDEEEDDEPEAKPAAKPAAKAAPARPGAKPAAKPAQLAKRPAPARPRVAATPVRKGGGGSLGKSMILFVVIVGGLAAAFALLGREDSAGPAAPKWKTGDTPELEVTLDPNDKKKLSCAAPDDVAGHYCAFEAQGKPWSKGDVNDDKKLLKPYTTTDRIQVLGAGLWSDPALAGTLPAARFSAKCKYTVEGKMKKASVRWDVDGTWYDTNDVYTGSFSNCRLIP